MVIVSSKLKITEENSNAFCVASEANRQNARDRTHDRMKMRDLDLPIFFRYKHITYKHITIFRLHKARVCPTGFGATFAVVFFSIYRLRKFTWSAVTNRFKLSVQLKQLLLLYYKICP